MTPAFRQALGWSIALHAGLVASLPVTQSITYSVEQAPTSMEMILLPPEPPAPTAAVDPVPAAASPLPASVEAKPPEPQPPAWVSEARRGALSEVLPGYLRNPAPVYPRLARERGYEGTVLVEVEVLASGQPGTMRVLESSGHPLLDTAALQAIRRWTFRPAHRWHTPISLIVEIPVRFRLVGAYVKNGDTH